MTPSIANARMLIGRRLAMVSAVFFIVVAVIMAMNRYILIRADPLRAPALQSLLEELEGDQENSELREQIRELDLMARRAFFLRQWQIRTGAILLIVSAAIFILSLHLMAINGQRETPAPQKCPGLDNPWTAATRARRLITAAGLMIAVIAWALALWSGRDGADAVFVAAPHVTGRVSQPVPSPIPARPDGFYRQWPTFRGPDGLGIARYADPPIRWDGVGGDGVLWKTEVPRSGFNSPAVWNDRVFITGADHERREVYCYHAETGELLWRADTEGIPGSPETLPDVMGDTGYAASSVAVDEQRVIAIFSTGIILGLDFEGRRLWGRSLGVPDNPYGHASSLLIFADMVFVQYDQYGGSRLLALDVETGETRWEHARAADPSWASPVLVEKEDRMLLILAAAPMVSAYDARTGDDLWNSDVLSGEIGSSPAYAAGRLFAANQYAQAAALDPLTGRTIWTSTRLELPDAASPVATARHLLIPTSYGAFSCVDASDGTLLWEHDFASGGYASPVLAAGRIYWMTRDGVMRIFKAGGTFEKIGEPVLGEESVSTPAAVAGRLYIRGVKHLFCIGEE